jgi:hypothetical protein
MLGSTVLDVVIGLMFVFFVFSLTGSASRTASAPWSTMGGSGRCRDRVTQAKAPEAECYNWDSARKEERCGRERVDAAAQVCASIANWQPRRRMRATGGKR